MLWLPHEDHILKRDVVILTILFLTLGFMSLCTVKIFFFQHKIILYGFV